MSDLEFYKIIKDKPCYLDAVELVKLANERGKNNSEFKKFAVWLYAEFEFGQTYAYGYYDFFHNIMHELFESETESEQTQSIIEGFSLIGYQYIKDKEQKEFYKELLIKIFDDALDHGLRSRLEVWGFKAVYLSEIILPFFNLLSFQENQIPIEGKAPEKKNKKIEAKHCALAYFFEKGENESPPKQAEFEKVLEEYSNKAKSGNTIRKKYDDILNTSGNDMFNKSFLLETYGDDWRDIVLSIAHEKEKLDSYLKSRHL